MASAALFGAQAGAGLLGGLFGSMGASAAENTLNHGLVDANSSNYTLYNQIRQDQAPYANAGAGAVNYLSYLLGIGGGPNGQMSGGGGGGSQGPTNTASSIMWQGAANGKVISNGSGSFVWDPTSHNKRTYSFMYSDGQGNDVYQRTGGNKGDGSPNDYAIVGKDGKTTLAAQPPIAQYGNGQITDAMKNDPNFGSLMHDFSASDFQADPGYAFRLQEGQKALDRSAASKGALFSGGTLKDSINYNSGMASQEFGNAYNRYQTNRATKYNQLASLAGMGQISANTTAGATQNLANNNAYNIMSNAGDEANARASAYSSWSKGITNALNAAQNWYAQSHPNGTSAAPTSGAKTGVGVYN